MISSANDDIYSLVTNFEREKFEKREDRRKKEQAQKKRDKKSKQKQNRNSKKEKENSSSKNNETAGCHVAVQNVKPVLEPSNENTNNQPKTKSGKGPKKGEATSTPLAQGDTSTVHN